jgi:hypothetical protein
MRRERLKPKIKKKIPISFSRIRLKASKFYFDEVWLKPRLT